MLIEEVIKMERKLSEINLNGNERKNILDYLTQDNNCYEYVLRQAEVKLLVTCLNNPHCPRNYVELCSQELRSLLC